MPLIVRRTLQSYFILLCSFAEDVFSGMPDILRGHLRTLRCCLDPSTALILGTSLSHVQQYVGWLLCALKPCGLTALIASQQHDQ